MIAANYYETTEADILAPTTEAEALVDLGYSSDVIKARLQQRTYRRRPHLRDHHR